MKVYDIETNDTQTLGFVNEIIKTAYYDLFESKKLNTSYIVSERDNDYILMNTKEVALFVNYLFEISFNIDNIMNFIDKNGDDLNPVASIIAEETGSPICMNCVMEKIGEIACKILSTLPDLIIDDNDNGKYGGSSILKLTLNEDFEFNYSPNEYDGDLMAIVTNKNIK